ncbi:hypothetical protein C809_02234 [Lachnospiraceae bacterium MD335]|nr:hypothetical protein C809_02234 [Lachnospiraceae bacterium MD335]
MKLWAEGEEGSIGTAIQMKVSEVKANVNRQVKSRAVRAVNVMRTAEKQVLKGQRSGRKYRKPYTGSKTKEERKKSGYKPRMYTASAPGEAPARRTGTLRLHWNGDMETRDTSSGMEVIAVLESGEKYAAMLENGTSNIAPRPFVEKIKKNAEPEIRKIYGEPYT